MEKIKYSWASYYNRMTGEVFVEVDELAEALSKSWGNIPKTLNDRRAFEIHCLAKGYLALQKELEREKNRTL